MIVRENAEPVLSIIVLTQQQSVLVTRLVMQLIAMVNDYCGDTGKVRILVSDSSRDDRTMTALTALSANVSFCSIRKAVGPFDSADEHLHDALLAATGTYVWPLADDALPTRDALAHIFLLIERYNPHIVVINPSLFPRDNPDLAHHYIVPPRCFAPATGQDLVTTYRDIIRHVGPIHLSCMVSALVFRREPALAADWQGCLAVTPIFAHCIALLGAFRDARAVFTLRHLVSYRLGSTNTGVQDCLSSLCRKLDVSDVYFRTGGLARLLVFAITRSYLSVEDLPALRGVQPGESIFLLTVDICAGLLEKLSGDLKSKKSLLPLTRREISDIETFLLYLPTDQFSVFERALAVARVIYPLILGAGDSGDYGYRELSRELTLYPENEQEAIWQEFSAWGIGEIKSLERDIAKLQKAVV